MQFDWLIASPYYRLTNWLMFLCGQIQSPRPDLMPDRMEGIARAKGFVSARIETSASYSLAKPGIRRPNSNGVSRRFSKFVSFTDQSGAEIKTSASTNR